MSVEENAARIIRTAAESMGLDIAIALWNGERIGPAAGPAIKVNDPMAVRQLALHPNFDTVVELWAAKAVDIEDGTIFDIAERPGNRGLKHKLKNLPKWQLLKEVPALLFGARGAAVSGLDGTNPFVRGSNKDAISHHYDVSNAFYQLFLDKRMLYSCAYFTDWNNSLDKAQEDKLDLICRKLRLKQGESMLDIGCGWGALMIHAAKHYGVTVQGVSLSEAQTEFARRRIKEEGLEDKINIQIMPYDRVEGQFDKISSIEMFEHVGRPSHSAYFACVNRLLKPGGLYLHQATTRRMKRSEAKWRRMAPEYRAVVKYIFPGGDLDHPAMSIGNMESHGFEVHDVENLRPHFAKTCRIWAERLHARMDEAAAEVGESKARLWLLYLAGVSLGFERGTIQVNQTLASKRKRGLNAVPPTRKDLYR